MIHVNQFVHPAERFPRELKKLDLEIWASENAERDNASVYKYLDGLVELFKSMLGDKELGYLDRITRFIEHAGGQVNLPEEQEEQMRITYKLVVEDFNRIKEFVTHSLKEALKGEEQVVKEFTQERAFLRDELSFYKCRVRDLTKQIFNLQTSLSRERAYNMEYFVEEQVTQLCDRAYYTHNQDIKDSSHKYPEKDWPPELDPTLLDQRVKNDIEVL